MQQARRASIWTRQGIWRQGARLLRGETPYIFEKDKAEIDRLNRQHFFVKALAGGRSFFAPVKHPRLILDIASGTGIWGRELAERFKQTIVWNVDKDEAIYEQAKRAIAFPPNFRFKPWTYPAPLPFAANSFDYIHARFIGVFVKTADWPAMIGDMLRVTKPGGWIGLMESDRLHTAAPAANVLQEAMLVFLQQYGIAPDVSGGRLEEWAREAGLTALTSKVLAGGGGSVKEREALIKILCGAAANAAVNLLAAEMFSKEEMEGLQRDLPGELRSQGCSMNFYAVWGQKPV